MKTSDQKTFLASISETDDFTYRKILRVDLEKDRCDIIKSDPEGWQPEEGPIAGQLARFALDGAVHKEDVERFVTFTRLDQLQRAFDGRKEVLSMIYRRKTDGGFRWNLMEVIPDYHKETHFVTLCVKDVDDLFQGGLASGSQEMVRDLEDRAYIISSLSSLFFTTYYVDLEQDTFRAVTQVGRVGDVLGDEVNYTSALCIYANHFIHPEDRAEYLSIMDLKNLRSSLRWWQPIVAAEYRKISEEPGAKADNWIWVRASAVLARTGEDDMPKTAVYVAQDITEGRRNTTLPKESERNV